MSEHTPEPWLNMYDSLRGTRCQLHTPDGEPIATFEGSEDALRAAACVNACAGMANPAAEIARLRVADRLLDLAQKGLADATSSHSDAVDMCKYMTGEMDRMKAEVAKLRACRDALETIMGCVHVKRDDTIWGGAFAKARAALAATERKE